MMKFKKPKKWVVLLAILLAGSLLGVSGCRRSNPHQIEVRELEKLYTHRMHWGLLDKGFWMTDLLEYGELLERRIEMLPSSTIDDSMTLVRKVPRKIRQRFAGSFDDILNHYGYEALDEIRELFLETEDPSIRGGLFSSVISIARSKKAYGKDTLIVLSEALKDGRDARPLDKLPSTVSIIAVMAYEAAEELIAPEHLEQFKHVGSSQTQSWRERRASLLSEWISQNLSCLYIDSQSGKFTLDKAAIAEKRPTSYPQERTGETNGVRQDVSIRLEDWEPLSPPAEWRFPDKLRQLKDPLSY